MSISLIVLVGIISLSTTAVRYQVQDSLKGQVAGNTLYSLKRMQSEIEDASVIFQPTTTGTAVSGCTNWSSVTSAKLDSARNVGSFCYWVSGGILRRHFSSGASCSNLAASSASCVGGTAEVVVANPPGVFLKDDLTYVFARAGDSNIELHYVVGNSTPTGAQPIPTGVKMDIKINTNKAYTNTTD